MGLVTDEYTSMDYPNGQGGRKVNDLPQPDTWHGRAPEFAIPPSVAMPEDMPARWRYEFEDLYDVWRDRLDRNRIRYRYYDGKNALKDFGISTPPELLSVETVVGWPNKAVMALAERSRFDGFTADTDEVQAALDALSARSRLPIKYRQTAESVGVYGCCFGTVGVTSLGPRIDIYDAEHASGRWDEAQGRLAYGMTVEFGDGEAVLTLYSEDANVVARLDRDRRWAWEAYPHSMGRPLMEAFAYRPTQRKPLGQSRITRAVMSITDSAVRAALGGDVSFQFAVAPQKYLLGADRSAFAHQTRWEAYIGNILAVGRDGAGELPKFGQLPQASMQQYTEFMRDLAARFSGETNVPISQLGVIHDNPSSAEAIYAASEPLIIECEDMNDGARSTLRELAQMALAAQLDVPLDALPDEWRDFTPNMANPAMPSIVSMADAAVKIAGVVPGFAGTPAFWKMIGMPEDTRREIEAQQAQANAQALLTQLLTPRAEPQVPQEAEAENEGTDG